MKKYVLTGGFCVGKTTTINLLKEQGYRVMEETSKKLIENYYSEHRKYPWNNSNKYEFLDLAFNKQLEGEKLLKGDNPIFFDRCIIDRLAFYEFENLVSPLNFRKVPKSIEKYEKIFFIEKLPEENYKIETHRPHSNKDSLRFEKILLETYKSYGYKLIRVPALSPEERIKFIISQIKE